MNPFAGKRIVILGAGASGLGAFDLAKKKGFSDLLMVSRNPPHWALGEESLKEDLVDKNTIVVKSPGISWDNKILQMAQRAGATIMGEVNWACAFLRPNFPLIAISGTNGKTTTVAMVCQALELAQWKVAIRGNGARPLSSLVGEEDNFAVGIVEVSSFQLEGELNFFHPFLGAIINISPSHSERYPDFASYQRAKAQILQNMEGKDTFFIPPQLAHLAVGASCPVKIISPEVTLKDYSLDGFKLPGKHNLVNLAFCAGIVEELIRLYPEKGDALKGGMEKMINTFKGLPHRLEVVSSSGREQIYNDSKSTNWTATKMALEALAMAPRPLFLIAGGAIRKMEDTLPPSFLSIIQERVEQLFLYGEAGEKLGRDLPSSISTPICYTRDFGQLCQQIAKERNFATLLLSPMFPSYDQFSSFAERGDVFKKVFR